ncbi:MAG: hypothetical protein M1816_003328, partial [Peltula sp. TS41687]
MRRSTITIWFVAAVALSLPIPRPQDNNAAEDFVAAASSLPVPRSQDNNNNNNGEDENLLVAAAPKELPEEDSRQYQTAPSLILKPFGHREIPPPPKTQKVPPKTKPKALPPPKEKPPPVKENPPEAPSPADTETDRRDDFPLPLPPNPPTPNTPVPLPPPATAPKPSSPKPLRKGPTTPSPSKPPSDTFSPTFPTSLKSQLPPSVLRSLTIPSLLNPPASSSSSSSSSTTTTTTTNINALIKSTRPRPTEPLPKALRLLNNHMTLSSREPIPLAGALALPAPAEPLEINRCNTEVAHGNEQVGSVPCGALDAATDVELSRQTPFDRFLLQHLVSVKDCGLAGQCYLSECPLE